MASFQNKKPVQEHVYADAVVWQCPECHCWSRLDFTLDAQPKCPRCKSAMNQTTKSVRVD